jgi:hypothetical protein
MNKQAFDETIGEVPRSTVDVDAVVARGRRAARFRLVANPWVATAAGVVAVTVAVIAPHPGGSTGGTPATAPSSAPPSTSLRPPDPCAGIRLPERSEDAAVRLTGVLNAAVRHQLPSGSQLAPSPAGAGHAALEVYHEGSPPRQVAGDCADGHEGFEAWAAVLRGGGKGNIHLAIGIALDDTPPQCVPNADAPGQTHCEIQNGPGGERITLITLHEPGGPTTNYVTFARTDRTSVTLVSENVADDGKKGGRPESSAPPLTHQQLVAIGLDPGLTLFP